MGPDASWCARRMDATPAPQSATELASERRCLRGEWLRAPARSMKLGEINLARIEDPGPRAADSERAKDSRHHLQVIADMRHQGFKVPNIDPNDGGCEARVLIFLETPGTHAVISNFVSLDNPSSSARNMRTVLEQVGIRRRLILRWNVVPYCISSSSESRNANVVQVQTTCF
jgi:hypothetical protein